MRVLMLFLLCLAASSCGYLDEELFVDDETFEAGFGSGSIGLRGSGHSFGCGGYGHYGYRAARVGLRMPSVSISAMGAGELSKMSDAQILENTDVEIIDETPVAAPPANIVEQVYFSTLAERDEGLLRFY